MFSELNNILDIDCARPPNGRKILVTEAQCEGSFLLHHLVALYLKGNHHVCLVGLSQSYAHYSHVANKLGVNFNVAKENGNLLFIEGLKCLGEYICNKATGDGLTQKSTSHDWDCLSTNSNNLCNLYQLIKKSVDGWEDCRTKPTLVVIDDLSVLLSLGIKSKEISYLMHYLRELVCPGINSLGCLATLVHHNGDAGTDDEQGEVLLRQLYHHSNLVLKTAGLLTGYSKDVHGELTVVWRDPAQTEGIQDKRQVMQFKVTEKNVFFFAQGMSVAVL